MKGLRMEVLRTVTLLFLLFILTGCPPKSVVVEEITQEGPSEAEPGVVPEEEAVLEPAPEEAVLEEEIPSRERMPTVEGIPSEELTEETIEALQAEEMAVAKKYPEEEMKLEEVPEFEPLAELTRIVEETGRLYTIYFDFDKYTIKDTEKEKLAKNAEWLRKNPDVRILIEGHADERGEIEYNLALGEKRAISVKRYLVDFGISPDRISTISYGEERPVDPRHNEEAWAKNRRAEFVVIKR